MIYQRDPNGVRNRIDGKGDPWANQHRSQLGPTFNMTDVDGMIGLVAFASNTANKIFVEYVPDSYANHNNTIREFATVAMFDRKSSKSHAFSESNRVSLAWHLNTCRQLAKTQPKPPKFFLVIGQDSPPWTLIELNINDASQVATLNLTAANWKTIWEAVGLIALRSELRSWITSNQP